MRKAFILCILLVSSQANSEDSKVEVEFKKIVASQYIPTPVLDSLVYRTYIIEKITKENSTEQKK